LPFFHIFHIISHFNLLFFHIFHIISQISSRKLKCEMIWKKGKSNNSDKIWNIWKKGKLNSKKLWKIWKKGKLNFPYLFH
jgi:hypothetical protein